MGHFFIAGSASPASHDSEKGARQERECPGSWQEAGGCKSAGLTWARRARSGHSPARNVGEQGTDFGDRTGAEAPTMLVLGLAEDQACPGGTQRLQHPREGTAPAPGPHCATAREGDVGTQWQRDRDIPRPGVKLLPQFPPSLDKCGAVGGQECGPGFPQGRRFAGGCSFNPFFHPKYRAEKVSQTPPSRTVSPCPIPAPATNTGTSSGQPPWATHK